MAVEISTLDLDCHRCKDNPDLQRRRGCKAPTEFVQHVFHDGTKFYRCPGTLLTAEMRYYIELWHDLQQGFLPFPGVKQQQPAKLMAILDIISVHKKRLEDARNHKLDEIVKGSGGRKKNRNYDRIR